MGVIRDFVPDFRGSKMKDMHVAVFSNPLFIDHFLSSCQKPFEKKVVRNPSKSWLVGTQARADLSLSDNTKLS